MFPKYYQCSSCMEKFEFKLREALYCLDSAPIGTQVSDESLLSVPIRPAWCKDCGSVTIVEDIESLRAFEDAYAASRGGRPIEYPFKSDHVEAEQVCDVAEAYLRWRLARRSPPRALCCGRSNYQFMDVETPLLKHAECEFGFINGFYEIRAGSYRTPGVYYPVDIQVFTAEGELAGLLTWRTPDRQHWQVEPLAYPPAVAE